MRCLIVTFDLIEFSIIKLGNPTAMLAGETPIGFTEMTVARTFSSLTKENKEVNLCEIIRVCPIRAGILNIIFRTRGYFASTMALDEQMVMEYIRHRVRLFYYNTIN